jgi:hypothetical protein
MQFRVRMTYRPLGVGSDVRVVSNHQDRPPLLLQLDKEAFDLL